MSKVDYRNTAQTQSYKSSACEVSTSYIWVWDEKWDESYLEPDMVWGNVCWMLVWTCFHACDSVTDVWT